MKARIVSITQDPFLVAGAAARTCYSPELVYPGDVAGWDGLEKLLSDVFAAGHHTLFEHIYITFVLEGLSRLAIWSHFHLHPFYDSSQQSQRYVSMKEAGFVQPPLPPNAVAIYQGCLERQRAAYLELTRTLTVPAEGALQERFGRVNQSQVQKKAQEIARYVLPLATKANFYHTINLITLLRLWRLCEQLDAAWEKRQVVGEMVGAVLKIAPEIGILLSEPIPREETLAQQLINKYPASLEARLEFDLSLGGKHSALISWPSYGDRILAQAIRDVLGVARRNMDDVEAIQQILNPAENPYLGEPLNLGMHDPIMRALSHIHFAFRTRLSHTADSQRQRHRTTPGSQPLLTATFPPEPDYATPVLIANCPEALKLYWETMNSTWAVINELLEIGVGRETAVYLLPNAVTLRLTESGNLLGWWHRFGKRLCFNAQREIWQITVEQVQQIRSVLPEIGQWLAPPCTLRYQAGIMPPCPEGKRFCGVQVWKTPVQEWDRLV